METKPTIYLKGRETEFEVQAEAYFRLREAFPCVRGEIRCRFLKVKGRRSQRGARFDLVICDAGMNLLCTVEVKDETYRIHDKPLICKHGQSIFTSVPPHPSAGRKS